MKYYEPRGGEGYEWVMPVDNDGWEQMREIDGTSLEKSWKSVQVQVLREDEGQIFRRSDFPWFLSRSLVMRVSAVLALRDILEAHGELLPLAASDEDKLFVFNSRVVDALDENRAAILRFDTGKIMRVKKPAFIDERIRGLDVFRVAYGGSSTYVSERFVERVQKAGLVGLDFREVWTIEE